MKRFVRITEGHPIRKMHGCGNDFVVFADMGEALDSPGPEEREIVRRVCRRHFGIGADGLIAIMRSRIPEATYRMRFFNPDGSDSQMCGNGVRCMGKYLIDNMDVSDTGTISIDTDAGLVELEVVQNDVARATIRVCMGEPELMNPDQVVGESSGNGVTRVSSCGVDGLIYVGMGNPHAVGFVSDPHAWILEYGPRIEADTSVFPQKTNVEFAGVDSADEITMFVWERGAGETLACGTGACATFVAAVLDGRMRERGVVHLPGGDLEIEWPGPGSPVYMTGPAQNVYTIDPESLDAYLSV